MHRAHADDLAGAARDLGPDPAEQKLDDGLARAEELAGKIDADDLLPLCQRHPFDGRVPLQAGIIYENVERPELRDDVAKHFADLTLLRNVCLIGHRLDAVAA